MIKNISLLALAFVFVKCNSPSQTESSEPIAFDVHQMDKSADACHDFYQWSVGTWMQENPVPATESRWMSFSILAQKNEEKLKVILQEIAASESYTTGSTQQLLGDLYKSAVNRDDNADLNFSVLSPYIAGIDNISSVEDMYQYMPKLMNVGVSAGMAFYIGADRKNSAQNIATMYQTGLNLPNRDYYLKQDKDKVEIRAAYKKHIVAMYNLLKLANGDSAAEKVLAFETKLAEVTWTKRQKRNHHKTYNIRFVDQYNDSLKNIPLRFLLDNYGIQGIDSMIVSHPSYIVALDSIIGATDIGELKAYLKWSLINSYANFLNEETEKEHFDFYARTLKGKKEMKTKEDRVLRFVNHMLSEPMGKLFVEKHFPAESKEYMSEMIENLRLAYKESIENLTWMSDDTKTKALEKLAAFTYKVGYPDKWKDYSKLEISEKSLLGNVINIRAYRRQFMLDKLGKPVDRSEWGMPPQMVNAYYNPTNNEIVFPAGILQPPFFHPSFDHAINYGGIGGVIGHEFTHGFDDQGSKFDGNGNLQMWWTKEDRAAFDKLTGALASQYSSYQVIDSNHIDGKMTLGENIADLGGVTLGYAALQLKLGDNPPAPIDGFTWQQRFFLGWANVWKGNITDQELKSRLITDNHSPAKYRVLGPLSNSPEFIDAFGIDCKEGSSVKKKEDQIKIW
jgi:putative endopeptidase